MWILTPSLTSRFAQATGESTLPSRESLANAFAQSLTQKSKVSPSRTWSQKLKRDTWTTHLSGAICDPSRGTSFTAWWVSCLADFRVSHSQQRESATLTPIRVTSSLPSSMVSLDADPDLFSWKMSRGSSAPSSPETNGATQPEPLFCSMSSASWSAWVTAQRQDYSRRAKQAHRTSASAPSSWPTIRASEYKDVGPVGSKSHQHMLGKHYLCAVVTQEECGLAAPEKPSTHGSRQGFAAQEMWTTPAALEASEVVGMRPSRAATGRTTDYLHRQVNTPSEKLNPRWVETLQGIPVGWTMPSCASPVTPVSMNCGSSETESACPPVSVPFEL